jgi:hypothetical protein
MADPRVFAWFHYRIDRKLGSLLQVMVNKVASLFMGFPLFESVKSIILILDFYVLKVGFLLLIPIPQLI